MTDAPVTQVSARAYRIPTSSPESDGTFEWNNTTLVVAHVAAGGHQGIGYSYAASGAVPVIHDSLAPAIMQGDAMDTHGLWMRMCISVRNIGRSGVAACAISAVDTALWDLKAKLLGVPLITLLGKMRDSIPVYGSGGFCNYSPQEVAHQIGGWREQGILLFKIKIGRDEAHDLNRIAAAADALPPLGKLFVDANGAYYPAQAIHMAELMRERNIAWFEEPVSSDDLPGLREVRSHAPAGMAIAAGEYSFTLDDSRRLLEAQAVDVLQIDATRAQGITGFIKAAALAEAYHFHVSSHCAPGLHVPLMCHVAGAQHIEYFWDHARIERMLFDGMDNVEDGVLTPQTSRPGFGWEFKEKDAEQYAL